MKAMIITPDPQLYADLACQGAARMPALGMTMRFASLHEAALRTAGEEPELIIVDGSELDDAGADQLERLTRRHAGASFVLLARGNQQDLLIRAMRVGVREVLALPLDSRALHGALDRIEQNSGGGTRDGKILAFVSCKGGSGATFLSANFGFALAELADKKTLLIDLHGQFGDAVLYVSDQTPAVTLADVCGQIGRIDAAFLAASLVQVTPRFGVLAAVDDPNIVERPTPEQITTVLALARRHYDYVVLDMGREIDALSLRAFDAADVIYPVLQLALPDIRDARRLLDIFRSLGYPAAHTRLIVNRFEKGGKLRLVDLQTALGVEVAYTIPNDYVAVSDSVNQGVPVLQLSRSSAVARSLAELVGQVTQRRTCESRGLFERLFGRAELDV